MYIFKPSSSLRSLYNKLETLSNRVRNSSSLFEQRMENGKKVKELGVGIFAMTTDELSEAGKKGNKKYR